MTAPAAGSAAATAFRVDLRGVVQGVGFRPFVHRLATRHGLSGWIRNEAGGVQIVVEGDPTALRTFMDALVNEAPPLATISMMQVAAIEPHHYDGFAIAASADQPDARQPVSPDVALCDDCETELFDPANRRYRYPFITCTNCGPRFTVIEAMPYDRERTSMRAFPQCPDCRHEYDSPDSRRYHSETNSCPACGPTVRFVTAGAAIASGEREMALEYAARLLRIGLIVAIRGLGGFHLAVDATNDAAVRRLRERKSREAKPLAVMVRTVDEAEKLGVIGPVERALLTGRARPIVLLERRAASPLAASIAPGLDTIGVMTAYTPLHHLLLDLVGVPLVMTSGNRSEEPIATSNEDAQRRLAGIADAFLLHDRDIVARYDDSVVRPVDDAPLFLRRARGYAPLPVALPVEAPQPLVAVGPHLKNTFTLAHGTSAYVSQHIGDLETLETAEHFQAALAMYERLFRITPRVAARDKHPDYLSTRIADELGLERVIAVQHHHAHLAAVAAEHGITERVIAVTYDGTGYGDDGRIWGGEVLVGDLTDYQRVGHLRYAPLPGGDAAARQPWRAALGYCLLEPGSQQAFQRSFKHVSPTEMAVARRQVEAGLNAPHASSMGRLFDAAAAVLGLRDRMQFEGQAAMELEALAGTRAAVPLPFPLRESDTGVLLDPLPLLIALGEQAQAGHDVRDLAARFHESVAATSVAAVRRVRDDMGITTVALGGGCFQNARLLHAMVAGLRADKFTVLVPRRLSPNDGSISYGQAAVAAALLQQEG